MGLFNNLVIYDQHKPQNSMGDIVPELATSWAWDSAGTALSFKLREGVIWHDGKPFTAKDVKCTFDLLQDKAQDKFRKNPRRDLFNNISDVTTNGDFDVVLEVNGTRPAGQPPPRTIASTTMRAAPRRQVVPHWPSPLPSPPRASRWTAPPLAAC